MTFQQALDKLAKTTELTPDDLDAIRAAIRSGPSGNYDNWSSSDYDWESSQY